MPKSGSITLSDIAGKLELLRVECEKCGRKGQYRVLRLLRELGPDMTIVAWREMISADCPKRSAGRLYDQCGVCCPDLPKLFARPTPTPQPRRRPSAPT